MGTGDATEKVTVETYPRCEEGGQIAALDTLSKRPLGSVGRFRGRGELKSRKVVGDSHTGVKVKDATSIMRPQ